MGRAIASRLIQFVLVLALVVVGATALFSASPVAGQQVVRSDAFRRARHLPVPNVSTLDRYWRNLDSVLHGHLGYSYAVQGPVTSVIKQGLPISLEIVSVSFIVAMVLSIGGAFVSVSRLRGLRDRAVTFLSAILMSVPAFVGAGVAVYLVAMRARLFPPAEWVSLTTSLGGNLDHLVLPVLILGVLGAVLPLRVFRGELAAILEEDYVLAARSRGLPERYVLFRYALRPASLSLFAISGVVLGYLITGDVVIEEFFSDPGIGYQLAFAQSNNDFALVQGIVLFMALGIMVANLIADLCSLIADPRLRGRLDSGG